MPQKNILAFVLIVMLSACAGTGEPRTNPFGLTDPLDEKPEDYGVIITKINSDFSEIATIHFVPYDPLRKKYGVSDAQTGPNDVGDLSSRDIPATMGVAVDPEPETIPTFNDSKMTPKSEPTINTIQDDFSLIPVDQPYQVIALKPGHYVIDHIFLGREWQARGGLHKVSEKPMYGGFEIKSGELLYLGDLNITTDRMEYKNTNMMAQSSPLGVLIGTIVYMSVPTFQDDDVALGIVDKSADAKAYMEKTYPKLDHDFVYRPLELGYYAGQNHGD